MNVDRCYSTYLTAMTEVYPGMEGDALSVPGTDPLGIIYRSLIAEPWTATCLSWCYLGNGESEAFVYRLADDMRSFDSKR
jgi:hypothetical protein